MALRHRVIPPTLKIDEPNPKLRIGESPFYLSLERRPWVRAGDHPRRASVSSFGFGGSNFHITLEEYAGARRPGRLNHFEKELVVVCGADGRAVAAAARELAANPPATPDGLRWVAIESHRAYEPAASARLAVIASDFDGLAASLTAAAQRIEAEPEGDFSLPDGTAFGVGAHEGGVAFLFPGQGSQHLSMGADLAMSFDACIGPWDRAADLELEDGVSLPDVVFPPPRFSDDEKDADRARLTDTRQAQPAIGCASLSHLALMRSLGVEPAMVAGHSFGEVTALHAAGVLDEAEFLRVARTRGELMHEAAKTPGSMLALAMPLAKVRELIERYGADVGVANHNHPTQVVLSGPTEAIDGFERRLNGDGLDGKRLPVATAFHSSVVSPSCAPFAKALKKVRFSAPNLPVYSGVGAAPHAKKPQAIRDALATQIASPIDFVAMIRAMFEAGARTFVEVGPRSVLTGLTDKILEGRDHLAVSLERKGRSGTEGLLLALARLSAAGVQMDLGQLFAEYAEPTDPGVYQAPRLALQINGSNYGKPYPPSGGAAALPRPNPPTRSTTRTPALHVKNPEPPPAVPTNGQDGHADLAEPPSIAAIPPAAAQSIAPVAAPAPATPSAVAIATPDWLATFRETQRRTAEVQAMYQATMTQAHTAYLQMAGASLQALSPLAALSAPGAALSAPAFVPATPFAAAPAAAGPAPVVLPPAPVVAAPAPVVAAPVPVAAPAPVVAPAPVAAAPAPVVAAPAPSTSEAPDMSGLVLDVVAESTGYPSDMLSPEMALEGDLGIDSIKRVEILSAVQDRIPGLPEVDAAHMGSLETLGEIVDYIEGLLGSGVKAATADGEGLRPFDGGVALGRYALETVPAPANGLTQPGLYDGPVYVTGDGTSLNAELAELLRARHVDAHAVDALPDGANAVVFVGGLRALGCEDDAIAIDREAFAAARTIAGSEPRLFVTVQDTGGHFGLGPIPEHRAYLAGLAALTRTAGQEWPAASVKSIDLEAAGRDPKTLALVLAEELTGGGSQSEVALPADGPRATLRSVAAEVRPGRQVIGAGDVVVVSGGARGVTAGCVVEWARATGATFVLLGRTPLTEEPASCAGVADDSGLKRALLADAKSVGEAIKPAELGRRASKVLAVREIRRTLAAIEAAGGAGRYVTANVTDIAGVSAALDRVRDELGPITGLVHAAGVLADRRIVDKSDADFDFVFDTKIEGLRALLAATADDALKVLAVFSSVSARCGNNGQSDYAMANEVLARVALAESRRRPDALVKSFGWGPWAGGMVTPALEARFAELGVPMIPLDVGARMFVDEMTDADPDDVDLVFGGEPDAEALLVEGASERQVQMEVWVDAESHPYLADHAIAGTPVVPVVTVADWFARAARSARPTQHLSSLDDLKVLKGVRLDDFGSGGNRFVISCRFIADDSEAITLELRSAEGALHYRAQARMTDDPPTSREAPPSIAEGAWGESPVYGDVLFHGKAFQVIEHLDGVSDEGITARLRGVKPMGWPEEPWALDVAALDGGLQLALLYTQHVLGGASLPTSIESVRSFASTPGEGPLRCLAVRRGLRDAGATTDIVIMNESGERLAELNGVRTHLLPKPAGSAARA